MTRRSVEAVIQALNNSDVRYLVVGGLAVVAHGVVRFTADIDLVLDPDSESLQRAIAALSTLGYRPRAPVDFDDLADPVKRADWVTQKNMTVFSLFSDLHAATEVDLFVEPPFDFDTAYGDALSVEIADGQFATIVDRPRLIAMKRKVGRPEDLLDIERLESANDDES